jgi:hypothetical protein
VVRYLICCLIFASSLVVAQDCPDDEVCFFDVPGAQCADGTDTGFAITYRKGARDLLILLDGGGACWSHGTCSSGTAKQLTAYGKYEGAYSHPDNPLNEGMGEIANTNALFSSGYHMVRVPYCTGDVFIGNQIQNYGTSAAPYPIRHVGYKNLQLILAEVKKRVPDADRVIFYGTSAGGIGVSWNTPLVAQNYPKSELYVINDGGTLFQAPFVDKKKLSEVYGNWNAAANLPAGVTYSNSDALASQMVKYNQTNYPSARYAYLSTYNDMVMTMFAGLLKATKLTSVVKRAIVHLADHEFAASDKYQVFYKQGTEHVFFKEDASTVESLGVALDEWLDDMLNDKSSWSSVRPDKP